MSKLKRKDKACFSVQCNKHPYKAIKEVFTSYHLADIWEEIELWKEISLSNDMSIYDNGESRENLLSFCGHLVKLTEVLYLIYEKRPSTIKKKAARKLPKEAIAIIEDSNRIMYLDDKERENPMLVLTDFFATFSLSYAKIEIQDMLEAVISYEGKRQVKIDYSMVLYKCLNNLLKSAKAIMKEDSAV